MKSIMSKRRRALCFAGVATGSLLFTPNVFAACSYQVSNNWGAGFTAAIRITNDTSSTINGWQVNWRYQTNAVTNAWNAQLSGNYSASNVGWNRSIAPGQSVEFGIQGVTNGGPVETPQVTGALCGTSNTSSSASSSSSSLAPSSSSSSVAASSDSSVAPTATNIALAAVATTSYVSPWETLSAVNDNSNPSNSNDKSSGAYGNWNNPNSIQWVQYEWPQQQRLERAQIYWFDDNGGVLVPTTAYVEYWDGSSWIYAGEVPLTENAFNDLEFDEIETNRLRVSMLNTQQSTGILEWRVYGVATGNSSSSSSSSSSGNTGGPVPYRAITTEFTRFDVNTSNALYMDTDRFRAYYGGNGLNGGQGNLANVSSSQIAFGLSHLEAAYECFVNEWGFRSTSLSANSDSGPYYKMNLYSTTTLNAGGAMGADAQYRLSFIEFRDNAINRPETAVHEFGHSLTYTDYTWVDQGRTGAWWETVANWVADTYNTDALCEDVRVRNGLQRDRDTIIDLEANIALSHLQIVSTRNYYQAWPFLTYLTKNPDQYPGLGRMAVPDLMSNHLRNNETPLHVLARLTAPVSAQRVLGRYWARMAYLDINHPKAQARYLSTRNNAGFRTRAYANLTALGSGRYRVKADRAPLYGGANITPLSVSSGTVNARVINLGNGLSDSNFTATLSIRNTQSGSVRYVDLVNGAANTAVANNEEVSLVVANTPNNLYLYNAFESTTSSPDAIGLQYEVELTGAAPMHL